MRFFNALKNLSPGIFARWNAAYTFDSYNFYNFSFVTPKNMGCSRGFFVCNSPIFYSAVVHTVTI